ncbi:MAG TPA: tetratricopeptide repeat protein [Nannocystaceae bacterium]|nr:tetratricopeptide repeat protein [Nannocystaceae bacterium]
MRSLSIAVAAVVVACSSDPPVEVVETKAAVDPGPPTFHRDVAPILFRACAECHHDGGAGPFALIEYDDVRDHAKQVVDVTSRGLMPPWLPEPGLVRYVGERRLSDDERDVLARWVAAGRPEGDVADRTQAPVFGTGWRLGEPDVVLTASESFTLPAEGNDVYRNFVIRVPPAADGWMQSVEIQPGDPKVVHHAVLRVDRTGTAARRDAEDPEPGFSGMDFANAQMPDGRFLGWTPGRAPDAGSVARSWRLQEGTDIVLQVHLRPSGKPETIQPRLGLHVAERPATRRALAMELSSTAIDLPPGAKDVVVEDRWTVPIDAFAITVYPHAHYLGKTLEAWADLPDGTRRWLVKIPQWNFDWQEQYRFAEPVSLPAGTKLAMRYTFDNSADNPRNPSDPPVHVRYGPQSTDEMAELILEIEPAQTSDLAALDEALMKAWLDRQIRHFERQRKAKPDDVEVLATLGSLEARRGRPEQAIERYEAALAKAPERFSTRTDLAIVLMDQKDLARAQTELERAVKLAPDDARAQMTLGNLLRKRRDLGGAIEHLARATELEPTSTEAWNNLGISYEQAKRLEEAAAAFEKAVALAPKRPLFQENLARVHAARGQDADALAGYRAVLEMDPNAIGALKGMALLLARSAEDGAQANALKAIQMAQRAAKLTGARDASVLEVLAAAYQTANQRDKAIPTAMRALELAREAGDAALIDRLEMRLSDLREG